MSNLYDKPKIRRFFGLFIGPSGSGKTSAAVTFPKPELLDFDLRNDGATWTQSIVPDGSKVEYKAFTPDKGWDEVSKRLDQIKMELNARPSKIYSYETLICDSLTALSHMYLTDCAKMDPKTKEAVVRGNIVGSLRIPGPADWNYQYNAAYQTYDYLRGFPINVISTAHVVDRYEKQSDPYAAPVVAGEKLTLTDKLGANILIYFDEVYRFGKEKEGKKIVYWVQFRDGDLARTVYTQLPDGKQDITGKNFYQFWKSLVEKPA